MIDDEIRSLAASPMPLTSSHVAQSQSRSSNQIEYGGNTVVLVAPTLHILEVNTKNGT